MHDREHAPHPPRLLRRPPHRAITSSWRRAGAPSAPAPVDRGDEYDGRRMRTSARQAGPVSAWRTPARAPTAASSVLTFVPTPWLDGKHTIFGEVVDVDGDGTRPRGTRVEQRGDHRAAESSRTTIVSSRSANLVAPAAVVRPRRVLTSCGAVLLRSVSRRSSGPLTSNARIWLRRCGRVSPSDETRRARIASTAPLRAFLPRSPGPTEQRGRQRRRPLGRTFRGCVAAGGWGDSPPRRPRPCRKRVSPAP